MENKKGSAVVIAAIIIILALGVGAIGWKAISIKNRSSVSQDDFDNKKPDKNPADSQPAESSGGSTFSQSGNVTDGCHIVYEKPGNPAIDVELVFKINSQCNYGAGNKDCLYTDGDLYCGQKVKIDGKILESKEDLPSKVQVATLKAEKPDDKSTICCSPRWDERDPDYLGFVSYVNPKFNYEIKWRQEWRKQGDNEPPYPPPPASMSFSRKFSTDDTSPEICDFSILAFDGADSFDGELESRINEPEFKQRGFNFGNSLSGSLFMIDNDFQKVKTIYFKHHNAAFRMGYNITKTERTMQECLPTFEKMIDSFRFND